MPKNTDILGLLFILLLFGKKQNLSHLHKIAQLINNLDRISQVALSPQLLSAMSSLDSIAPLISSLSAESNFEDYDSENRNAIF